MVIIFLPFFKLEEIKDNKMNLLKRYCTPVIRDYIKSNSNQILLTAYNIKFKISWNGILLFNYSLRYFRSLSFYILKNPLRYKRYKGLKVYATKICVLTVIIPFITLLLRPNVFFQTLLMMLANNNGRFLS